ncbi:DNA repair protein Nse1 [Sphaerosporella brunnea]|uniref:Non-structural maintenance of chromosomes element 1 homolog n=1 Tax=Sphaerosporella brunnea TaxID=1250544 RepID=A0A5J5EZZ7_9PEZI|nr:DNA repair protein Nse1 [Sphaerosporella brunnea]
MPYSDLHRALAQTFLLQPTITAKEAKKIIASLEAAEAGPNHEGDLRPITDAIVSGYIADLNEELSKFDFEIRNMRDQKDRGTIYAFVNSTPDTLIQSATHHSADEIAFFRRLLDAMFETNNTRRAEVFAVREQEALHLNKNPPRAEGEATATGGLTIKGAEEALAAFVEEGWLVKSRNNWYSLAPRGLLELSVYLNQTYTDSDDEEDASDDDEEYHARKRIKKCHACSELLTVGQRCEKLSCDVRMHEPCAVSFFRINKDKKCPRCKTTWTGKESVGEAAAGKLRRHVQKRAAVPTRQKRREETVEEGEEEQEEEEQQQQRQQEAEEDDDE